MPSHRKMLACSLLIMLTLIGSIGSGYAIVRQLKIPNSETIVYPIELTVDDHVLIQFTVLGQSTNTLHFSLASPNGTVRDFGEIGNCHFTFVCTAKGNYLLNFNNTDLDEKSVTLDFEIEHYIFDMPQMLFMTLLIAVVCVGGVAVFIMLSKKP